MPGVPVVMSFLNDSIHLEPRHDPQVQLGNRGMLKGQTTLIVEAQYLIALDLQATLEDLSSAHVLIARDPSQAAELTTLLSDVDLAIVEVERNLPANVQFVAELFRQGIPVIGVTADQELPKSLNWLSGVPLLLKPTPSDRIIDAIEVVQPSQKE